LFRKFVDLELKPLKVYYSFEGNFGLTFNFLRFFKVVLKEVVVGGAYHIDTHRSIPIKEKAKKILKQVKTHENKLEFRKTLDFFFTKPSIL
jgi:hypothetical protein